MTARNAIINVVPGTSLGPWLIWVRWSPAFPPRGS
jgi:hypothetical protein